MIIIYTQPDGTVEQVSTDSLSALESASIEDAMDGTSWRTVENRLRDQDPTAMRAVLWAVRKRTEPQLAFADFDVPGWKRRLKARIERQDIDEVFDSILVEALATSEDASIDAMLPHLRKLAHNRDDIDAALNALGKGHLAAGPADSED